MFSRLHQSDNAYIYIYSDMQHLGVLLSAVFCYHLVILLLSLFHVRLFFCAVVIYVLYLSFTTNFFYIIVTFPHINLT